LVCGGERGERGLRSISNNIYFNTTCPAKAGEAQSR